MDYRGSCGQILPSHYYQHKRSNEKQTNTNNPIFPYFYSGVHCIVFQCFIVSSLLDFIQCGFKFHYDDILLKFYYYITYCIVSFFLLLKRKKYKQFSYKIFMHKYVLFVKVVAITHVCIISTFFEYFVR